MSNITIYNFEGTSIRVVLDEKGEPWFVANDIATALGYEDARRAVVQHVPDDDRVERPVIDAIGRSQNTNTTNESGMYALIMGSKLEGAKRFKRWVTAEVLPSIRKTGSYSRSSAPTTSALTSQQDVERQTVLDFSIFVLKYVPSVRPEMMAACAARALAAGNLISKPMHEELRNALSVDWDKAPSLTPTEIGQKLGGVKPTVVNKMLEARGLQKKLGKKWEPTEEGKEYAGAVSYQAENSEHKGVQLKWAPEIVEVLQEPMDEAVVIKSKLLV